MRRVEATREVVNSVRLKCSDKIIDMFLIILFLNIVLEDCFDGSFRRQFFEDCFKDCFEYSFEDCIDDSFEGCIDDSFEGCFDDSEKPKKGSGK